MGNKILSFKNGIPKDFKAWLVKCNPDDWDLMKAIEKCDHIASSWQVFKSCKSDLMAPGHPIVFWASTPKNSKLKPGVWAIGHVTSTVFKSRPDKYWTNPVAAKKSDLYVGVSIELIPYEKRLKVSMDQLKSNPKLKKKFK
jgi:hypothetical protein